MLVTAYWSTINLGLFLALVYLCKLAPAQWAELNRRRGEYQGAGLLLARVGLALVSLGFGIWIVSCWWAVWCWRLAPHLGGLQ